MSNSAAPRDFNPEARNAPGPLAINMYLARWLDDRNIEVIEKGTKAINLVATNTDLAIDGLRLILVPVDVETVISIEVLAATGDNQHLLHDRVVIHQVDLAGEAGFERRQTVLDSDVQINESWSNGSIEITVTQVMKTNSITTASIQVTIAS
jgi:hypothetical protein